ncbi:probable disease resistance protein At1g58390 [Salvia hispanica]|uniref:probable disease resistance protein At1g58390 n=1 Tax=Salvia hispanica TaxID=49212 RepID=UPI0020097292|nr:probable disease resistance protein At1g58390 [Salvia hispanica]
MAESLANVCLETLRDLLVEETKFLLSVSGDVEKVKRDLRSIHALLKKADRDRSDSPTLKSCISELKDLAFKAENMLETYHVEVQSKREGRRSLKEKFRRYICIISECCSIHKVGNEARDIISALADLTKKLDSEFGQKSSPVSEEEDERQRELRQIYAHDVDADFVGMEKEIELLVSKVKDETRTKRVVKIYGMGGLGKTTLAKKVYNHADLQSYARALVCITQKFQLKAVFGEILEQFDSSAQIRGMTKRELVARISNFCEERKCLVVIDDIWEIDDWEIIRQAFPPNCNVILTTRNKDIANQQSEPYKLRFLTEDEGHGEGVGKYERVNQVLELSYDALPYYLKPCFLYLACFPEDHKIDTEKLYLLWMAEGFISYQDKGPNETLRDVAQRYLTELGMRCMVQLHRDEYYSPLNKFDTCGLHDLMHDLCSSKAEEEKFLKRIDASKYLTDILSPTQTRLVIPPSIGNSISRLAISCDFEREVSGINGLEEVKGLRSFILLQKSYGMIDFKESTIDFKMSQYLRIFVVEGCEFEGGKLPIKMCEDEKTKASVSPISWHRSDWRGETKTRWATRVGDIRMDQQ